MPYDIRYEDRGSYLFVHISGPESYDEASRFWEKLKSEVDARKMDRVLVVDEVTGVLEFEDVTWLSLKIAVLFYGKSIAYVDPKEESYVANSFGESIVAGQGVKVRLFRNERDAVAWIAPDGKPSA